jgi:hypothetical protein
MPVAFLTEKKGTAQAPWPAERQGIVPDLQIGTALCELKGIRSDRSHSNYDGAQVTGVEKRGVKIPMEIQKQAVDLDEKMFGVAAPAVGPCVAAAAQ